MARLVPLTVCYSLPEALVLRSMLCAHGIFSHAVGLAHSAVDWRLLVALQGIEVRVVDEELGKARSLLAAAQAGDSSRSEFLTEAEAFRQRPVFNVFVVFAVLFGIFPLVPVWIRRRHRIN